jgi:UDP-N-acetylmuramate--alanine ligase
MSGIAELLVNLGYRVSGSDIAESAITARLKEMGVQVFAGHDDAHVRDADVVVVSSAVRRDNPEVVAAQRRRIPVIPRAEMLAELMRLRYGIAVAGAHGKTTTTSMIALALERAGLDPTAVIGGRLSAFGSNARLGGGRVMVAEADESDGSFLKLSPAIAVITNIDREHLEHYGELSHLGRAFVEFANRVPFDGVVVACLDDPVLAGLLGQVSRRVVTYALDDHGATLRGMDVALEPFASRCEVGLQRADGSRERLGTLVLNVPGRHNLLNGLAAVAVGLELGVPFRQLAAALAEFHGAERRFQVIGEVDGVLVVDDYGHHPTEIDAVISAARLNPRRRLLIVFQPHRYTRTAALLQEFGAVLARADELVLTDIYAASEDPIPGVTAEALAAAVREHGALRVHAVKSLEQIPAFVADLARGGDLVLTLGAGSVGLLGERILAALRARRPHGGES